MPDLTSTIVVRPDVVHRTLGEEALLLNLESGMYYGLNAVGTRAWTLLQSESVGDACGVLATEFDAPVDQIRRDVLNLVTELIDKGLVDLAGDDLA